MKIYIVSDTHGCVRNIEKFISYIVNTEYDTVVHLGDDSKDCEVFSNHKINYISVPGVYEDIYTLAGTQRRKIVNFSNLFVLLTHTIKRHENDPVDEPSPEELKRLVDCIFFGHTHVPEIKIEPVETVLEKKNKFVILVNPGHLKDYDKRGFLPTFAEVNISYPEIDVEIKSLVDFSILMKEKFVFG